MIKKITSKRSLVLFLVTITLIFFGCWKEKQKDIYFFNGSPKSFYVFPSLSYPDTTFIISDYYYIEPNHKTDLTKKNGWINEIDQNGDNTLILFLIEKDSLTKYSWNDDTTSNNNLTKTYILTVDYLRSVDWTVSYP